MRHRYRSQLHRIVQLLRRGVVFHNIWVSSLLGGLHREQLFILFQQYDVVWKRFVFDCRSHYCRNILYHYKEAHCGSAIYSYFDSRCRAVCLPILFVRNFAMLSNDLSPNDTNTLLSTSTETDFVFSTLSHRLYPLPQGDEKSHYRRKLFRNTRTVKGFFIEYFCNDFLLNKFGAILNNVGQQIPLELVETTKFTKNK